MTDRIPTGDTVDLLPWAGGLSDIEVGGDATGFDPNEWRDPMTLEQHIAKAHMDAFGVDVAPTAYLGVTVNRPEAPTITVCRFTGPVSAPTGSS